MFYNHYLSKGVALNPPISFGTQHSYETRRPKHCAAAGRVLLKDFFVIRLPHGGTLYHQYYLLILFQATCINTFLI